MALPYGFNGPTEYFVEFFKFLEKYDHLFNLPNTHLLVNHTLDKIGVDASNIDISKDFDLRTLNNEYVKEFFRNLDKFHVEFDEFKHKDDLEYFIDVPLSPKKKHEIVYLANEIENVCKNVICDTIVDFGSGLGYLDEQLFKTTHYNVLGLECNEAHYVAAKRRQRKYHCDSFQRVKYIKHTVNQHSYVNIEGYMKDKFPNSNGFCIAGLHACADLTVDAIDIFLKMKNANALAIMPCCYHRIAEDDLNRYQNLPISKTLKEVYERYNGFKYITIPFLRLAAQPLKREVGKLENLVFNLLSRAVLQLYACKYGYKLKRNKRKAVRLKCLENNFEAYAAYAVNGFRLLSDETSEFEEKHENRSRFQEEKFDVNELLSIWRQIPQVTFKKTAIFVLLQNHMQPVFENFVLYDRLLYLQENGIKNCRFKRIVNENISPRCLALLAQK